MSHHVTSQLNKTIRQFIAAESTTTRTVAESFGDDTVVGWMGRLGLMRGVVALVLQAQTGHVAQRPQQVFGSNGTSRTVDMKHLPDRCIGIEVRIVVTITYQQQK